ATQESGPSQLQEARRPIASNGNWSGRVWSGHGGILAWITQYTGEKNDGHNGWRPRWRQFGPRRQRPSRGPTTTPSPNLRRADAEVRGLRGADLHGVWA